MCSRKCKVGLLLIGFVLATATIISLLRVGRTETPQYNTTTPKEEPSTVGKLWSVTEIARHNTTSDCWIIVEDKVYDVTQYIPFHPGGSQQIINWCGKEASDAFNTKGGQGEGHSGSAKNQLGKYYIGNVDTTNQ